MRERLFTPFVVLAVLALAAFVLMPSGGKRVLHLSFEGLPPLENGHFYEGWAVIDGEEWSTGTFRVGPNGALVGLDGNATGGDYLSGIDLTDAVMVAITLHAPGQAGETSVPHLLSGPVTDFKANLSTHGFGALEASFDDATAVAKITEQGVRLAYIDLPQLSAGWTYEAWVETAEAPVSLGRFGEADDHSVHDHSGDHPAEDTAGLVPYAEIDSAVDPRGGNIFISIETVDDDSPAPLGITIVSVDVPAGADDDSVFALTHDASSMPSGLALIR